MGIGPAKAVSSAGVARTLPTEFGPRDGSGVLLAQSIDAIGPNYQALTSPAPVSAVSEEPADQPEVQVEEDALF